jgi:hypothetical protein
MIGGFTGGFIGGLRDSQIERGWGDSLIFFQIYFVIFISTRIQNNPLSPHPFTPYIIFYYFIRVINY